jgi:hypothetical protein
MNQKFILSFLLSSVMAGSVTADQTLYQEIVKKSQQQNLDLTQLLLENNLNPDAYTKVEPGLDELYLGFKMSGEPAPQWLISEIFPQTGEQTNRNDSRDGGDGPEDATLIEDTTIGSCYTDSGTTEDKSDIMPSPVEIPGSCESSGYTSSFSAPDAWYVFTLDVDTYVDVTTCWANTLYDTAIGFFDENLIPYAVNDDAACDVAFRSSLECVFPAGTYYLVIDGYNAAALGEYEVELCFLENPCDEFLPTIETADIPGVISGDNTEAVDAFLGDGGDMGYEITTEGGLFTFSACNENTFWDVDLFLFDTNPCDGGAQIANSTWSNCLDGSSPGAAVMSNIALEAGTYFLLVSDLGIGFGEFEITVFSPCDTYSDSVEEYTAPLTFSGNNVGAINIYGGDGGEAGFDITIPEDDLWTIDACHVSTTYDVDFWIFDANPCEGGALLHTVVTSSCQAPFGAAVVRDLPLTAGVYHLVVGNTWINEGDFEILIEPTPDRPTSGGPDEMGYTWSNSFDEAGPEFEWVNISGTGDPVALTDDSSNGPLDIGFNFPFYEEAFPQLYISSNGFLSFGVGSSTLSNTNIPNTNPPNNIIAMFWDDLNPASGGQVYSYQDTANDRFIVQFDQVLGYGGSVPYSFQAILYPNGHIVLQYLDVDEGDIASATIGTENTDGTIGLEINFNDVGCLIQDESAIYIEAIDGDFIAPTIVHTPINGYFETEVEGDFEISANITDASGVDEAWISWSNGGAYSDVPMTAAGDTYTADIPHQEAGLTISYYISANDIAEDPNQRITTTWSFEVISYTWPPVNLSASSNLATGIQLNWEPPVNPGLFSALELGMNVDQLMEVYQLSKTEALAYYEQMHSHNEREFIEYKIYRNNEHIHSTTDLGYLDPAGDDIDPEVPYVYEITADYDSGESDFSESDQGVYHDVTGGYTWMASDETGGPAFDWVDISGTGSPLALTDDSSNGPIDLGFEFPFFDEVKTSCFVGSNGFISFDEGSSSLSNQNLPTDWAPNNLIAVLWDDLNPASGGTVYALSDVENGRFIVQYEAVPAYGGSVPFTFQAILHESGLILLQYLELDESDIGSTTIGIENSSGTIGFNVLFDGTGLSLEEEMAVLILPPSTCEAIECDGIPEVEPNEGWNDENASYGMIQCDDVICGSIMEDGQPTGTDWFMYNHFGGDVLFAVEVSTFNAVLSLHEFSPDGDVVMEVDVMPACASEILAINALESGTYLLQVRHEGEDVIEEPGTYALTLLCSGDPCSGHIPVECEGTNEVEPNEGWNDGNASFGEIAFEETICGTVTAVDGERDMDWFHFTTNSYVNLEVTSLIDAFDGTLFLTDFATEGETILAIDDAPACHGESFTIDCLPPGEYFLVIAPATAFGVPVPQNYSLTLTTSVCSEASCYDVIDAGELTSVYTAFRPMPFADHNNSLNGCSETIASPGFDEAHMLVLANDVTDGIFFTMQGEGDADEVIYILGDCANPDVTCGAVVNEFGVGTEGEVLELEAIPAGTYYFVADFASIEGSASYSLEIGFGTGVDSREITSFALHQNYPNPFNPLTSISWDQAELAPATLTIHNILGAVVSEINLGIRGPGTHVYEWDASQLGSGIYFYTFQSSNFVETQKAMLVK